MELLRRGGQLSVPFGILSLVLLLLWITPGPVRGEVAVGWWSRAAKPYRGVVLHGISQDTAVTRYIARKIKPIFERKTGIRIKLEFVSWDDLYVRSMKDMALGRGQFDFVYIGQGMAATYLAQNYLVNLSHMSRIEALSVPRFTFKAFNSSLDCYRSPGTGDIYGIPVEGWLKVYAYRKDLFEKPEIRDAFRKRYGYALAPAVTFEQYIDIAAFFSEWGRKRHLPLWGTTLQASVEHPASFHELMETIAPGFGVYHWGINEANWTASEEKGGRLNSDPAKAALRFWAGLLPHGTPGATGSTEEEAAAAFSAGHAAQGWILGEDILWIATDPKRSKVVGKIGIALPPVSIRALTENGSGNGYIGYSKIGAFGIPHASKNREAAFLWLQYLGQPSLQLDCSLKTGSIVHDSVLKHPRLEALDLHTGGYFTFYRKYNRVFRGSPAFCFHASMREIVAPYVQQVIQNNLSPEQALNKAAIRIDRLLARLKEKGLLTTK